MRPNEHHPLERNEGEEQQTHVETVWRQYQPLALLKSSLSFLSRCWRPEGDPDDQTSEHLAERKTKYMHTPTNAATSFLKTTTTRTMQRANEIL
ncbi:hypothetical protein C8A03DRAFT_31033 [Achaetomium macrosporum]|uniref:Uncharacterized protein n=1 Tax=Achaetomium macrosporum TaxID=79813 RepID=A0AAN7CFJ8_9PEZI|nr:hypothetical protein C8A03DRAFT_31033 [Achaetomium macrosporum]